MGSSPQGIENPVASIVPAKPSPESLLPMITSAMAPVSSSQSITPPANNVSFPPSSSLNSTAFPRIPPRQACADLECHLCSRIFKNNFKLRQHLAAYRHNFRCTESSCNWSFQARKDLRRHLLTHTTNRPSYFCSYSGCGYGQGSKEHSFSRRDLRDRHERRTHGRV